MINNYFITFISFFFILNGESLSQVQPDSVWNVQQIERELYEINLLKFTRLLRSKQIQLADSTFKNQIALLSNQFVELASQENFIDANIILESTLSLLSNWNVTSIIDERLIDLDFESDNNVETQSYFEWTKEVSFGGDQWQQEFEISIPEYDSVISEEMGNPFIQLRLGFDYDHQSYSLKLDGSYKNSRDYLASELNFNIERRLSENSELTLENRFESTTYKQSMDLTYWQNEISTDLEMKNIGKFSIDMEDKFLIRKNKPQSSSYTDYLQNQFSFNGNYAGGNNFLFGGSYELENRSYPIYSEKDYREHQLGLNY